MWLFNNNNVAREGGGFRAVLKEISDKVTLKWYLFSKFYEEQDDPIFVHVSGLFLHHEWWGM